MIELPIALFVLLCVTLGVYVALTVILIVTLAVSFHYAKKRRTAVRAPEKVSK